MRMAPLARPPATAGMTNSSKLGTGSSQIPGVPTTSIVHVSNRRTNKVNIVAIQKDGAAKPMMAIEAEKVIDKRSRFDGRDDAYRQGDEDGNHGPS